MLHANIICIGHVFLPEALFVMLVTYLSSNMALLSKINTKVSLELKRQLRKLLEELKIFSPHSRSRLSQKPPCHRASSQRSEIR